MLIISVPGINFGQKNEKEGPFIKLGVSEINITPQNSIRTGGKNRSYPESE